MALTRRNRISEGETRGKTDWRKPDLQRLVGDSKPREKIARGASNLGKILDSVGKANLFYYARAEVSALTFIC